MTGFVFRIGMSNRLIAITSVAPLMNILASGQVNQDGHNAMETV